MGKLPLHNHNTNIFKTLWIVTQALHLRKQFSLMSSPLVATTESRPFNVWDGASSSSTVAMASCVRCSVKLQLSRQSGCDKMGVVCMHNCQIHLAAIQQTFSSVICIVETERLFKLHWTDLMFTKRLWAQHVQCINSWLYLSDNGIRSTRKRSLFRGAQCHSSMVVRASRDIFAAHEGSCGEFDTDEIVFCVANQKAGTMQPKLHADYRCSKDSRGYITQEQGVHRHCQFCAPLWCL